MSDKQPLLQNLFHFLTHPSSQEAEKVKYSFLEKLLNVLRLWGIEIVFTIIIGIVLAIALSLVKYNNDQHAVTQLFESSSMLVVILLASIYAPISEELTFRFGLKYSPFRLSISLTMLASFCLELLNSYKIIDYTWIYRAIGLNNSFLQVIVTLLLGVIIGIGLGFVFRYKPLNENLSKLHGKWFPVLFYLSALVFGVVHSTNYEGLDKIWFLIPLLGLPQVFLGTILAYARANYGIIWSMLLHSLHNTLTILPLLFFSLGSDALKNTLKTTAESSTQVASSLTTMDDVLILLTLLYVLGLILVVLIIWIQAFYELVKARKAIV